MEARARIVKPTHLAAEAGLTQATCELYRRHGGKRCPAYLTVSMANDRAPTPMRWISKIINFFAAATRALTFAAAFGDNVLTVQVDLRQAPARLAGVAAAGQGRHVCLR